MINWAPITKHARWYCLKVVESLGSCDVPNTHEKKIPYKEEKKSHCVKHYPAEYTNKEISPELKMTVCWYDNTQALQRILSIQTWLEVVVEIMITNFSLKHTVQTVFSDGRVVKNELNVLIKCFLYAILRTKY